MNSLSVSSKTRFKKNTTMGTYNLLKKTFLDEIVQSFIN